MNQNSRAQDDAVADEPKDHVLTLLSKIYKLEAEIEELKQENASLRSGDNYERGAE